MLTAMILVLTGCVEDVSKDKTEAVVTDPVVTEKTEPTEVKTDAPAETWKVDTSVSTIKALGAKVTATHPIDFKTYEGTITVAGDAVTAVAFTVQMDSLVSDDERLTGHLKNEDFFDVAKFPTATFESTEIVAGGADGATHTVTGNLTIHGMTKGVTFPASVTLADGTATAKTEFALDRKDFGVVYPGKADDLVQDKVVLTVDFTAKKGV